MQRLSSGAACLFICNPTLYHRDRAFGNGVEYDSSLSSALGAQTFAYAAKRTLGRFILFCK